jgi:excisionase family DNA binding protein
MPPTTSKLLTTGQAAELCSVTPDTILKWIKKGRLFGVRTAGGHYRISRRDLEPLIVSPNPSVGMTRADPECDPKRLRCWEFFGEGGTVRNECNQCVVYRVRATRCFLMAGMDYDIGHAHRFCQNSCDDCVYYRRVNDLGTNVMVITRDDELIDNLAGAQDERITLRFARNSYEASAMFHDFQPAFVAVDVEHVPARANRLIDSLAADPRVPGIGVILVVPPEMTGRKRRQLKHDLIIGVLEKPFDSNQLAALLNRVPALSLMPDND